MSSTFPDLDEYENWLEIVMTHEGSNRGAPTLKDIHRTQQREVGQEVEVSSERRQKTALRAARSLPSQNLPLSFKNFLQHNPGSSFKRFSVNPAGGR